MKKILKHPLTLRFLFSVEVTVFVIVLVLLPLIVFAQTPTFTEFPVAYDTAKPCEIAKGSDNNLWFGHQSRSTIGKMTPSGVFTEYPIAGSNLGLCHVTLGPDGNIWFTEGFKNKIGKITPNGTITEYSAGPGSLHLTSLVFDNSGTLWVADYSYNKMLSFNTNGQPLNTYAVSDGPQGLSLGPDGNIWFAIQNTNEIGKLNPTNGSITKYAVTDIPGFTLSAFGSIWFNSPYLKRIGRINPSTGAISYYQASSSGFYVADLAKGPDGNVWFAKTSYGVGKINPNTGEINEYPSPYGTMGGTFGATDGPDNKLWFTVNNNRSRIVSLDLGLPNPLTPTPPPVNNEPAPVTEPTSTPTPPRESPGPGTGSTPDGSTDPGSDSGTDAPDEDIGNDIDPKAKTTVLIQQNGTTRAVVQTGINPEKKNLSLQNGDVLVVDGVLGRVDVRNGGSIKGIGKVGTLTVETGGTVAPGRSPGCLTTQDFILRGTYKADIGGKKSCTESDSVTVNGSVALSGKLDVSMWKKFSPKSLQEFMIINNDGKDAVVGHFDGLPEGFAFIAEGKPFTVSYLAGDGNDVAIKALRPDASLMALLNPRNDVNVPHIESFYETIVSYKSPAIIAELVLLIIVLGADIFIFQILRSGRELSDIFDEKYIHVFHPTHKT